MYDNEAFIKKIQHPLRITSHPFKKVAEECNTTEQQVIENIQDLLKQGYVRRIAGVLKHNKAGYNKNGMVVFDIPDQNCDEAGAILSQFSFISHCYKRKSYSQWPYTMYAMVHARNEKDFNEKISQICQSISYRSYKILISEKEFKKSTFYI